MRAFSRSEALAELAERTDKASAQLDDFDGTGYLTDAESREWADMAQQLAAYHVRIELAQKRAAGEETAERRAG